MQVFQQEIITRKLFQNIIIKQELYQPYKDNSVIVGICSNQLIPHTITTRCRLVIMEAASSF